MADRYVRRAMSSASDVPDRGLDKGVLKVAGVVVLGAVMSILDVTGRSPSRSTIRTIPTACPPRTGPCP
jgi:hypothetical protein